MQDSFLDFNEKNWPLIKKNLKKIVGEKINDSSHLKNLISNGRPNDRTMLTIIRDGKKKDHLQLKILDIILTLDYLQLHLLMKMSLRFRKTQQKHKSKELL